MSMGHLPALDRSRRTAKACCQSSETVEAQCLRNDGPAPTSPAANLAISPVVRPAKDFSSPGESTPTRPYFSFRVDRNSSASGGRGRPDFRSAESLFSRSEEHTSELQSLRHLVCRLLLEKKK